MIFHPSISFCFFIKKKKKQVSSAAACFGKYLKFESSNILLAFRNDV